MNAEKIITLLTNFRWADKYATFDKAMPGIKNTPQDQQDIISDLLNKCASSVINEYKKKNKPTKALLKDIVVAYMDDISKADVNMQNKDFGIELCWYIAEKAGLDLKKTSDTRQWGFWKVESGKVKTVTGIRKKKKSVSDKK